MYMNMLHEMGLRQEGRPVLELAVEGVFPLSGKCRPLQLRSGAGNRSETNDAKVSTCASAAAG